MAGKRPITAKQILFAQELAKVPSTPGASITSAHEKAYPDWNGLRKTRREAASRMAKNSNVLAIVDRIRKSMDLPTIEEHVADLDEVRTLAINAEQFSAAVKATEMQGRAAGHYVERSVSEHIHRVADSDLEAAVIEGVLGNQDQLWAIIDSALESPTVKQRIAERLAKPETKQ